MGWWICWLSLWANKNLWSCSTKQKSCSWKTKDRMYTTYLRFFWDFYVKWFVIKYVFFWELNVFFFKCYCLFALTKMNVYESDCYYKGINIRMEINNLNLNKSATAFWGKQLSRLTVSLTKTSNVGLSFSISVTIEDMIHKYCGKNP